MLLAVEQVHRCCWQFSRCADAAGSSTGAQMRLYHEIKAPLINAKRKENG